MMKFTFIAAVAILSTLASGSAPQDLTSGETIIRPEIAIQIKEEFPDTPCPPTNITEISRLSVYGVQTLLGFVVPSCTGHCTIRLSDVGSNGGYRAHLLSLSRHPIVGDTWNHRPWADIYQGTFKIADSGSATVVEDRGLTFACPETTTKFGFEMQPWWDEYHITWDIRTGGPFITCDRESDPVKVGGGELKI